MHGVWLIIVLVLAILFIIAATSRIRLHPFLVLLIAAYGVGILGGLPVGKVVKTITGGFGGTLGSIGIVIAAGTIIGSVLERSGGTRTIAHHVIKRIGKARSDLAMSITGAIVSIPVFCDSGFVILSPLNRSLAKESGKSLAVFAVALSMGLYATHVFVPPTPGPIAAAGTLHANIGEVIIMGLILSVPVVIATFFFARYAGKRIYIDPSEDPVAEQQPPDSLEQSSAINPGFWVALWPILIPVILIALSSVIQLTGLPVFMAGLVPVITFIGDPNTALLIGALLAFASLKNAGMGLFTECVSDGLKSAGSIILITGAGGALGAILRVTGIGDYIGSGLAHWDLGIFLPFLMAAALKTAQGSSTVAIITTASIVEPLAAHLGLGSGWGPVLVTLAIGAGSMTVSHANDSFFWVVTQFSGMDVSQGYRLQTIGSALAGITGILSVYLLHLFLSL